MTKGNAIRIGIMLVILSVMAIHCAALNEPRFRVVNPEQNAVFVESSFPFALDVDVAVPMPGCGRQQCAGHP